jgi:hypothetical protein
MTHLDAVEEQAALFGDMDLPSICLALRAGVNGMADYMDVDQVKNGLKMLQMRLDTWESGFKGAERFDNAVKEMVIATIEEVRTYLR